MDPVQLLGFAAATCTTAAFLPQVLRTFRTRDTAAISFWMYLIFSTGIVLWLAYGIAIGDRPIIVANAVTLLLSLPILALKLRHG